ncbi:hypothetical protein [Streptomyces sp. NPDC008125]|uniref:hypothetical protein n=1 Tax=Streptomyces sp. NPDC008125 TaxID=3364811 RepID=UPI0036E5FAB3
MPVDPAAVMAAYAVAGAGIAGLVYTELPDALDAADTLNRAAAGTTSTGYGCAYVVPVMAIRYPDPIPPTPPTSDGGEVDIPLP